MRKTEGFLKRKWKNILNVTCLFLIMVLAAFGDNKTTDNNTMYYSNETDWVWSVDTNMKDSTQAEIIAEIMNIRDNIMAIVYRADEVKEEEFYTGMIYRGWNTPEEKTAALTEENDNMLKLKKLGYTFSDNQIKIKIEQNFGRIEV